MEKRRSSFKISDNGRIVRCEDHSLVQPVEDCKLDTKCLVRTSGCGQRAFGALVEQLLPGRDTSWQRLSVRCRGIRKTAKTK